MMKPPRAATPRPLTPLDLAKVTPALRSIMVFAAFYSALASAGVKALETTAAAKGQAQVAEAKKEQAVAEEQAEEEDVIDKVVKLYDVY